MPVRCSVTARAHASPPALLKSPKSSCSKTRARRAPSRARPRRRSAIPWGSAGSPASGGSIFGSFIATRIRGAGRPDPNSPCAAATPSLCHAESASDVAGGAAKAIPPAGFAGSRERETSAFTGGFGRLSMGAWGMVRGCDATRSGPARVPRRSHATLDAQVAHTIFCSMATDDKETLTIRLPKGLKELVDRAAQFRETTVTNLVREALQENLSPAGRMYQPPGLSEKFDQFLEKSLEMSRERRRLTRAVNDPQVDVILLVEDEGTGHRYFFAGVFVEAFCKGSLVAIARPGRPPWIIPRRDVVAWYEGDQGRELATALARQGWAERSAA